MQILAFPDYLPQAQLLADAMGYDCLPLGLHHFPDGESLVTLPEIPLQERIYLYRSLEQPNDKLIELLLVSRAVRERGVSHITLIAPYLCYMRQDAAFHPGEVISQTVIGEFLAQQVEGLITVDPHLHRTASLGEAIPVSRAIALSPTALMAEFLQQQAPTAHLLGPDDESRQWVAQIAAHSGQAFSVAHKERLGDKSVRIQLPGETYPEHVVMVDDMVSTGHTLMEAAKLLQQKGVNKVDALVTHAMMDAATLQQMHAAGIEQIWSSDSINHNSNRLGLTPLLASALSDLNKEQQ